MECFDKTKVEAIPVCTPKATNKEQGIFQTLDNNSTINLITYLHVPLFKYPFSNKPTMNF